MSADMRRVHPPVPSSIYGPPPATEAPMVLVAEDDIDAMDIVTTMFRHAGFRVAQASTGTEALMMARELCPALLVLDVAMPGMTGWEVARQLRADADRAGPLPRILVLTAHAFAEDRLRARELGCDGYLAKPADVRRVVQEARRILAGEPWAFAADDAEDRL
jgi:two-component system, cell cycle response regulator DivK